MLKSLLVLLNDFDAGHQAVDLARQWAGSHRTELIGLNVVDLESIANAEPLQFGGTAVKPHRDEMVLERIRARFESNASNFRQLCADSRVNNQASTQDGLMGEVVGRESQRVDLVLVDRPQSHPVAGGLTNDQVLAIVKQSARPVVLVPHQPAAGTDALIAYDGSLQSARTLHAFVQSGLATERTVRVLGTADVQETANQRIAPAIEFLKRHDIEAQALAMASSDDPATVILTDIAAHPTGLIVMGTFGQNVLRETLFGSVTRRLIDRSPVPIFLFH